MAIPTTIMSSPLVLLLLFSALVGLLCSPAVANNNVLFNGHNDRLDPGESLINGSFRLTLEHDCRVVLYKNDVPIWQGSTSFPGGVCHLKVSEKGQLILYIGGIHIAVLSCGGGTQKGSYALLLGGDGSLNIYGPSFWSAFDVGGGRRENSLIMYPGSKTGNGSILTVRMIGLYMDEYCRLVSTKNRMVIWKSPPAEEIHGDKCYFEFTTSGELVTSYFVNDGTNEIKHRVWSSGVMSNAQDHILALPNLSVYGLLDTCRMFSTANIATGGRRAAYY